MRTLGYILLFIGALSLACLLAACRYEIKSTPHLESKQ